jgi:predicted PurR-regulated permease PerM
MILNKNTEMNITNNGHIRSSTIVRVAALVIILAGAYIARSIITPVLLALFISIICIQPIRWMEKKRIPRWIAMIVVALGLVLIFLGFSILIGGTLSFFINSVSKYESMLVAISNSFLQFLNDHGLSIPKEKVSGLIQSARIFEFTSGALKELLRLIGNAMLIFLIILFILMEFSSFTVKAKAILGLSDKSISYLSTITKNTRNYLVIKSLICLTNGILIYVALLIIGVDYPLLWATVAGLMNYIPNIGSIFATIPAVLFALIQLGMGGALWTLGAFVIIHNVLGNFIEPKIMGRGLGLSALVVLLSLLFWGYIMGPVGMFLSVPFTMTIKIILEQNEKTRWLAILLGSPEEAKIYLEQKEHNQNPVPSIVPKILFKMHKKTPSKKNTPAG